MATQTVAQQRATTAQVDRARRLHRLRTLGVMGWIVEILKYVVLVLLAVTFIMPFYWMLSSAVKTDSQVYTIPPIWFPVP